MTYEVYLARTIHYAPGLTPRHGRDILVIEDDRVVAHVLTTKTDDGETIQAGPGPLLGATKEYALGGFAYLVVRADDIQGWAHKMAHLQRPALEAGNNFHL